MRIDRRGLFRIAAGAGLASVLARRAGAQAQAPLWPNRFVRLVVPFAAGGANEAFARNLAARLSEIWGQQVVIENKPGAGGNIGAEAVARSDPDGLTMLIASFPHAVARFLYPSLGYDLTADLAPATLIGITPNIMVVPNASPARSVAEFIAHAKANKGKVSFASSGAGTSIHLSGELFTALADPVVRGRLEDLGIVVVGSTPAELATFLKAEIDKWGPVIKEAGISIRE